MCFFSPPLLSYAVITSSPGKELKWSEMPVPVFLDPAGSEDLLPDQSEGIILEAIEKFNDIDCSFGKLFFAGYTINPPETGIFIRWEENKWTESSSNDLDNQVSVTSISYSGYGMIYYADIICNGVDFKWGYGAGFFAGGIVDGKSVLLHEIGHAFGIGHSRIRSSVMFFASGQDSPSDLSEDDKNALCYLYPEKPFTSGKNCDSCLADSHCGDQGRCLIFPEGEAFCSEKCDENNSCPSSFVCSEIENNPYCFPANGVCGESESATPLGEYCYSHYVCESQYCFITPESAVCTKNCENQSGCPDGFICRTFTETGNSYCFKPGTNGFGQSCSSHLDCEKDLLCVGGTGYGFCTKLCSKDEECPDNAFCRVKMCASPGDRPIGTPCKSHFQCITALCATFGNFTRCTQYCDPENQTSCPEGTTCIKYKNGNFCAISGHQPQGGYCFNNSNCEQGLFCDFIYGGDGGICVSSAGDPQNDIFSENDDMSADNEYEYHEIVEIAWDIKSVELGFPKKSSGSCSINYSVDFNISFLLMLVVTAFIYKIRSEKRRSK
jgi:hypothetical protein